MTTAEVLAALHAAGYHAEHVMPADYIDVWTDAVPRGWATVEIEADQPEPLSVWVDQPDPYALRAYGGLSTILEVLPEALAAYELSEARDNNNGAAGAAKET